MSKSMAVQELNADTIRALQDAADKYAITAIARYRPLERAVALASGIKMLREMIQPLMPTIMELKGNQLGFLTDEQTRRKGVAYPAETVRDCAVEAILRGLMLTGKEWMILFDQCYTCANGYQRLVEEYPGITDLRCANTPPFAQGGQTCVKCSASWKIKGEGNMLRGANGEPYQIYAVTVNAGMGPDGIIGKARRRLYKAIHQLLSGTVFTEPDDGDEPPPALPAPEVPPPKTQTQTLIDHIQENAAPKVYRISQDQAAEIGRLRHVVTAEEFQLWVEEAGAFDVNQLSAAGADQVLERLKAVQRKDERPTR